jgi:hypothetical protein
MRSSQHLHDARRLRVLLLGHPCQNISEMAVITLCLFNRQTRVNASILFDELYQVTALRVHG